MMMWMKPWQLMCRVGLVLVVAHGLAMGEQAPSSLELSAHQLQERSRIHAAIVGLELNRDALSAIDVGRSFASDAAPIFSQTESADLHAIVFDGQFRGVSDGVIALSGEPMMLIGPSGRLVLGESLYLAHRVDPDLGYEWSMYQDAQLQQHLFDLSAERYELAMDRRGLIVDAHVQLGRHLAAALGVPQAVGRTLGSAVVQLSLTPLETQTVDATGMVIEAAVPPAAAEGEAMGASAPAGEFPVSGPDVIVGSITSVAQFGRTGDVGAGRVGLATGTISCNKGDTQVHWFALSSVNHPAIAQNLYRMRTIDGSTRFEQIGYSWFKHGFSTLAQDTCQFGCTPPGSSQLLGVGCSDPYGTSLNALQCLLAPRSVIHPYTGEMQLSVNLGSGGGCPTNYESNNHMDHDHVNDTVAHRLQVEDVDLLPNLNPGAEYFAEGQYVVPHEYAAGTQNMFNNVSYRKQTVSFDDVLDKFNFCFFGGCGQTFVEQPALNAWTGASQSLIEPAPGLDGRAILAYQATNLGGGQWHYEYALYNQNLDRALWYLEIPLPAGVQLTNAEFHAPRNHDPQPNAPTYSNQPWTMTVGPTSVIFRTSSFVTNPLANAVRWGTLYNFRFDANSPPLNVNARVGMFKTGEFVENVATVGPASLTPPEIVHGAPEVPYVSHAWTGYVDPRNDSDNGTDANMGMQVFTIRFDQPIRAIGGGAVTAASFEVFETGDVPPPTVVAASSSDNRTVRLSLSRPITIQEWTTIQVHVENLAGVPIPNLGNLGETSEPDRIDVGFLTCDTNQNGFVEPVDLTRHRQFQLGQGTVSVGTISDVGDINRDGVFSPVDLTRFRQLLAGEGNAIKPWLGEQLNHPRP